MVERMTKQIRTCTFLIGFLGILFVISGCTSESPILAVTPFALESAEFENTEIIEIPTPVPSLIEIEATPEPEIIEVLNDENYIEPLSVIPELDPLPTLTLMEQIPRGQALQFAKEEDIAREIVAPNPITFDSEPVALSFDEFFVDFDPFSTERPVISDKLLSLDGKRVILEGYMAPPLKLGLDWFMLTGFPMGFCPFHSSAATITPDIALIYVEGPELQYFYEPLRVEGELHIGEAVDWQTGMVSLVRIYTSEETVESIQLGGQ